MTDVEVLLTVGKLDASLALLTTRDHHVIEFPTMLLPENVKAGSIVKLQVSQNLEEEKKQKENFDSIQNKILEKYGMHKPELPVLKLVNVTQTSCVLAWDPLKLGSAKLKSLVLYRQGIRSMVIPSPLKVTETKISGLSVGTNYEFQLKLATTSGNFMSEIIKVTTHKMTDMTGITVCLGQLDPLQRITESQVEASLRTIGARPMQKSVAIDTTHFVYNDIDNEDDPELIRAKNSNIPIVRPEWVRACELEKRIVGVRGFYLDADPAILQNYTFPVASVGTSNISNDKQAIDRVEQSSTIEPAVEDNTASSEANDIAEAGNGLEIATDNEIEARSEPIQKDVVVADEKKEQFEEREVEVEAETYDDDVDQTQNTPIEKENEPASIDHETSGLDQKADDDIEVIPSTDINTGLTISEEPIAHQVDAPEVAQIEPPKEIELESEVIETKEPTENENDIKVDADPIDEPEKTEVEPEFVETKKSDDKERTLELDENSVASEQALTETVPTGQIEILGESTDNVASVKSEENKDVDELAEDDDINNTEQKNGDSTNSNLKKKKKNNKKKKNKKK